MNIEYAITYDQLLALSACSNQRNCFLATFKTGTAELNEENAIKAADAGLDLDWFVNNVFDFDRQQAYNEACSTFGAAYQTEVEPIRREWYGKRNAAWERYEAARNGGNNDAWNRAWDAYHRMLTEATTAIETAEYAAMLVYRRGVAGVFVRIYREQLAEEASNQ